MLYLVAKPSHVTTDVNRLACSSVLSYGLQLSEGRSEPTDRRCPVLSCCSGRCYLFRGACEALNLDISYGVDHPSICKIESYMEKSVFTKGGFM
jgi:hypothetical protein